ncbi:hypothetical protein Q7A53_06260 [Halobacillus rhizosphaerae]|uniref:hypothetical protein n=1 Tax=Halobacillus rhizosphaerae TaxID=3064889 RepID=UPI00398A7DB5
MNISEEKGFLFEMMKDVTKERRELTSIYYGLKTRLDQLNELEQRGIEDLSVKGYVDAYTDYERVNSIQNIQREANNLINRIEETAEKVKQGQTNTQEPKIPKHEIAEQRYQDNKDKPTPSPKKKKKKVQVDSKKLRELISETFRENEGEAMNAGMVFDIVMEKSEYDKEDVGLKNFRGNIFSRTVKDDEMIEKESRGYYIYNPRPEPTNYNELVAVNDTQEETVE